MTAPAEPAAPKTATARPRQPRKPRANPGGLLATATARTGDAPETPAETAPEAAVAVLEPTPAPELTWYPTIHDVVAAKFARWREAEPWPPIVPVPEAELPPPPPFPASPQPVGLTTADKEYLATVDAAIRATALDIERGVMQAVQDINAIHREHRPLVATPAEPPPPVAAQEQHHEEPSTGPPAWGPYEQLAPSEDTAVLEVGDGEPPDDAA